LTPAIPAKTNALPIFVILQSLDGRITALRLANAGYFLIVGWNLSAIGAALIASR
jgi:hypothetical protein